jgi:hypothetical protein
MNVCKFKVPNYIEATHNHFVACHLYDNEVMNNLEKYNHEYDLFIEEQEKAKALEEAKKNKFKIKKQQENEE